MFFFKYSSTEERTSSFSFSPAFHSRNSLSRSALLKGTLFLQLVPPPPLPLPQSPLPPHSTRLPEHPAVHFTCAWTAQQLAASDHSSGAGSAESWAFQRDSVMTSVTPRLLAL